MKYLPLSWNVWAVGHADLDDSRAPTCGHTDVCKISGVPQNVWDFSVYWFWANWKAKRSAGSGSTLLLNESHSCRYSFWWKTIAKQSNLKFNQNVFVVNGREHFWNIGVSFSCCCCYLECRQCDPLILFFLSLLEPPLPLVTGLEASRSQDWTSKPAEKIGRWGFLWPSQPAVSWKWV